MRSPFGTTGKPGDSPPGASRAVGTVDGMSGTGYGVVWDLDAADDFRVA
ncbi:MAG: hypothetical protein QOE61_510 [Micromonosporaceae bacterium]|nr:hypothetical protein [Micromonosporaceae bacterium]